jgi:hypothetical protein
MHRTRSGLSVNMTNTRPPKPPCWLDLKVQKSSSDEGGSKNSPVGPQPSSSVRASRPTKRTRARIHSTLQNSNYYYRMIIHNILGG